MKIFILCGNAALIVDRAIIPPPSVAKLWFNGSYLAATPLL